MAPSRPTGCRLVLGAAGYGKTTALRRWHPGADARWYPGEEVAPDGAAGLIRVLAEAAAQGRSQVIVEDLPQLPAQGAQQLLDAVAGLPDGVSVALSSRWPLAVSTARWVGRGLLTEVRAAALALNEDEVADVLAAGYGLRDPDLAERVSEATAGWPALVHLAAEAIASDGEPHGALVPAIAEPDSPLWTYVAEEVLGVLPVEIARLLRDASEFAPVTAGLCQALGHRRAAEAVRLLATTGLLVGDGPTRSGGSGPAPDARVVPLVAHVCRHAARLDARGSGRRRDPRTTAATAAGWYAQHGPPVAAARAFAHAGDQERCAQVLAEHGEAILAAGQAMAIVELATALPEHLLDRPVRLLLGDALRTTGDVVTAAQAYGVVAATEPDWDAGLAWRMGIVHYLRGDPRGALDRYARAEGTPTPDGALLLAWRSAAHLQAGDTATATELARRSYACACDAKHDGAIAAAHISLALCLGIGGDPADSEEHYAAALRIAERTGDIVLLTRILTNQTYHLLCEARFEEALEAARRTARCAAAAGHANLRSIAICNTGDALTMLGRYDEALQQYERAVALSRRMGSRRSAAALRGIGDVHRRRGWWEQARSAYEVAARVAEEGGDNQVLVSVLAGLARVLVTADPKAAAENAERAAELASDKVVGVALLAQGWVGLYAGDSSRAAELANDAAKAARADRDRAGIAEALELRAAAETDPARARAALREAHAIWASAGAGVDAARTLRALGALPDASTDDRLGALLAGDVLTTAGVVGNAAGALSPADPPGAVVIRAFGRFEVQLDDRPVPLAQWQSRKARDLLRILVARRGRPVPRPELCELLWPDDDATKTGHRLSVLLSIVRGVLDPYKAMATDHYLVADQASIALDISRVRVDVEDFLADVAHGRRLRDRGALAEARTLLVAAEQAYRADAFSDEPYADWSGPLREEARAAYASALRILAHASRELGDVGAAVGYLLRLLARDPYDEAGHRALVGTLVAGGQHGEARRAFDRYGEAMREIGVRPPDEAILTPRRAATTRPGSSPVRTPAR